MTKDAVNFVQLFGQTNKFTMLAYFYRHVSLCAYLSSTARSLCAGDGH